jgi:hypothetical protein
MYDLTAMKSPVEQPVICRDLVSTQDFSPAETKSLFELTHIINGQPGRHFPVHGPDEFSAG